MSSNRTKSIGVGVALGVWLSGVFVITLVSRIKFLDSVQVAFLISGALLWPIAYLAFFGSRFMPKRMGAVFNILLSIFFIASIISTFLSPTIYISLGYVVLTFGAILVSIQFNSNLDASLIETGFKIYAIITAALLVWLAIEIYQPGLRLGQAPYQFSQQQGVKVLNPNSIAMVGMSVILCAMAIRDLKVRIVVLFASITVMILTGSRTSTIATIFGLFVTSWYRIRFRSVIGKIIIVSVFFVVLIGVTLTINEVREAVSGFFALGDRKRGLGSGATGRFNAWQLTWELFMNYPLTGVGFRAHEKYFSGMEGASAHNGYLATLAEIGLIGFICNILLIFSGFLKLWRFARDPLLAYSHSILLGLGCGYLLLAMFERYLINIGNPTSLLFLLCVTIPPDSMVGSDGAMASTIVQSTEKDKKTNRSP